MSFNEFFHKIASSFQWKLNFSIKIAEPTVSEILNKYLVQCVDDLFIVDIKKKKNGCNLAAQVYITFDVSGNIITDQQKEQIAQVEKLPKRYRKRFSS